MPRHSCGFKLANDGVDSRALQEWLRHQNIQHTVRYPGLFTSHPGTMTYPHSLPL
jgi:site-specific recombinase XerD